MMSNTLKCLVRNNLYNHRHYNTPTPYPSPVTREELRAQSMDQVWFISESKLQVLDKFYLLMLLFGTVSNILL